MRVAVVGPAGDEELENFQEEWAKKIDSMSEEELREYEKKVEEELEKRAEEEGY